MFLCHLVNCINMVKNGTTFSFLEIGRSAFHVLFIPLASTVLFNDY